MADYKEVYDFLNNENASDIEKEALERKITMARVDKLAKYPIEGNFDFEHLSKIHKAIFDKLYNHAGQLRPETDYWAKQLTKTETSVFAHASEAKNMIDEVSQDIQDKGYFIGYDKERFIEEFTNAFAKVNSAHPFLEGNGRATRAMFSQIAEKAGFEFNISNINKDDWNYASLKSGMHEKTYLFGLIEKIPVPDTTLLKEVMNQAISESDKHVSLDNNQALSVESMRRYINQKVSDPEIRALKHEELNAKIPDIAAGKFDLPAPTKSLQPDVDTNSSNQSNQDIDR